MIMVLQTIIKPIFGEFECEELKKFLRMGLIFAFIIGSFWTIGVLKNALFCTFVGAAQMPWAKTASLFFLATLLMFYTRLFDLYNREKVFYLVSSIYAALSLVFSVIIAYTQRGQGCVIDGSQQWYEYVVGYAFFLFVESYGALIPALFWAIASDITKPESAKKGYSLVVAIGQLGGIVAPYFIAGLPRRLGLQTSAVSIFISVLTILASIYLMMRFFKKTPASLLVSYHGTNEKEAERQQEPGFMEGLQLMVTHKYLLGIFAAIAFPEIITTMIDLHFNSLAAQTYSGIYLAEYFGGYGSAVNFFAFIFLIFGIGNVTRLLGLGVSLLLMPIIYSGALLGFISLQSLNFLFLLMASSKAINYALNGPAIKQLYIPTTHDVRFKSQAWIESFGSQGAKQLGSIVNMSLAPLQKSLGAIVGSARHAWMVSYIGFSITFFWFFVALFLGRKHKAAVTENKVVC